MGEELGIPQMGQMRGREVRWDRPRLQARKVRAWSSWAVAGPTTLSGPEVKEHERITQL